MNTRDTFQRLRLSVVVALVAAAVLAGCQLGDPSPKLPSHPSCAVGVDVSGSTALPDIRARYLAAIGQVINYCSGEQGNLYVDVLSANSQASRSEPVSISLAPASQEQNDLYKRADAKEVKLDALTKVRDLLEHASSGGGGTDLLGGVVSLAHAYRQLEPQSPKVMILLTDGLQNRLLSIVGKPLDQRKIDELLKEARRDGLVPRLEKVRVHLVGVGAGVDAGRLDPAQWQGVHQWWESYFAATGADLVGYGKTMGTLP